MRQFVGPAEKPIVDGNNQLGIDLYHKLNPNPRENVSFSPFSIFVALGMAYEGAREQTAEDMRSVLHLPEGNNSEQFKLILNQMNSSSKYDLRIANALWAQKKYPFKAEFLNKIANFYFGEANNLDFSDAYGASRQINDWVEENTNHKIQNLISPAAINSLTRLVLTNAIYFKGKWVTQFDKKDTKSEDFYLANGEVTKVPTMRLISNPSHFKYGDFPTHQVLEMHYKGFGMSMMILLPREKDGLSSLENALTSENLSKWRDLFTTKVNIYLPKFRLETAYNISDTLKQLGMESAFGGNSDFSGMDGSLDLYLSDAVHKAFIDVNEEGTEAAAATGMMLTMRGGGFRTPTFRADHPFIYLLQDSKRNILFLGKVANPAHK